MILKDFFKDIYTQRNVIFQLAQKDFSARYLGSYLGIFWAFIHPALLTIVYWFVFQVGFRSSPIDDFPFILWLLAGIIPWFFFSESFSSAATSIEQHSYLVKKMVFKVHLLPIVKIVSSLVVHIVFLALTLMTFFSYGQGFSWYTLQVFYYLFCLIIFLVGTTWITASLNVFLKDIGQLVNVILQFGFWLTPIFWTFNLIPDKLKWVFKLNPVYYIVEGYRDSLIHRVGFWHHYNLTLFFWLVTILFLLIGSKLFKKLSPHFSDVL